MNTIDLGHVRLGAPDSCMLIAEVGINHEGDFGRAREMVDAAAEAGVDAVKFQIVEADTLFSRNMREDPFYDLFKRTELPDKTYGELYEQAVSKGMLFFASFNSSRGVSILRELDAPAFKIASTQMTNIPLVREAAACGKPILLSTGMATLGEIEQSVNAVRGCGNDQIAMFHCVSRYPTLPGHANLRVMNTLRCAFDVPVGYSDHVKGIEASILAASIGACMIERHFSLDTTRQGFDHRVSSEPGEFVELRRRINEVFAMLGQSTKLQEAYEEESRQQFRVSLVARRRIIKGRVLTEDDVACVRPGTGVPPLHLDRLMGKPAKRDLEVGELFDWGDL